MFKNRDKERISELEEAVRKLEKRVSEAYASLESATNLTATVWDNEEIYRLGGYIGGGPRIRTGKISLKEAIEALAKHAGLELQFVAGTETRAEFQKAKKVAA
jgi:hypothetical protein